MLSHADEKPNTVKNILAEQAKETVKKNVSEKVLDEVKKTAQTADPLTVAGFAVVGGVVAGIGYGCLKWYERKKRKHLEDVRFVEKNHKEHLCNIKISEYRTEDLPSFFEDDNGRLHASKDYRTRSELRTMVNDIPSIGMPIKCSDEVTRAMRKLLEFYEDRLERNWFWRGEEGDVTSAYLRSIICRLHEHGKNFQGTEHTSALLNAIRHSLNSFSMCHGEESERRSYIDLACRALKRATESLKQHKNDRTLADLIDEALPECDESAVKLLIILTKLTTPTHYWKYVDRCEDPRLLAQGIIKAEVINGAYATHSQAIMLHPSPIAQNIKSIALNYNEAKGHFKSNRKPGDNKIKTENFTPDEQALNLSIFSEKAKDLKGLIGEQYISNFLTTTSELKNPKTESGKTIPLDKYKHQKLIAERINIYHRFTRLGNDNVLIIKLYKELSKYAKEKGDEFIAQPKNAHYMFDILLELASDLRKQANALELDLKKVDKDHEYKTLVPEQAALFTAMKNVVEEIKGEICSSIKAIKNYRTESHYEHIRAEINLHEHRILEMFTDIAIERNLNLPPRENVLRGSESEKKHLPEEYIFDEKFPLEMDEIEDPEEPGLPKQYEDVSFKKLDVFLNEIAQRIIELRKTEAVADYQYIHACLIKARDKAGELHTSRDPEKHFRADQFIGLLYSLGKIISQFLNEDTKGHFNKTKIQTFVRMIEKEINQANNRFIHHHKSHLDSSSTTKVNGMASLFHFNSKTHHVFADILTACKSFAKNRNVIIKQDENVKELSENLKLDLSKEEKSENNEISFRKADYLLNDIEKKILALSLTEEVNLYTQILISLRNARVKAAKLTLDHNAIQQDRGDKILKLLNRLIQVFINFLDKEKNLRDDPNMKSALIDFFDKSTQAETAFLDDHQSRLGKFLSHHQQGFWRLFYYKPQSRKEFDNITTAIHQLTRT